MKIPKIYRRKLWRYIGTKQLNLEQIIVDDSKTLTIAPREGFQPLGLFCDPYSKEYNFPTLFYGNVILDLLYVHIKR